DRVPQSEVLAVARARPRPEWSVCPDVPRLVEAFGVLKGAVPDVGEDEPSVDVADAVVVPADSTIRVRHADARLVADVPLRAHDVVRRLVLPVEGERRVVRR